MSEKDNQVPPAHQQVTEGVPHLAYQLFLDQIQSREAEDCKEIVDDRPNR